MKFKCFVWEYYLKRRKKKQQLRLIDLSLGELLKTGGGDQSLSDSFITILINVWICFFLFFTSSTV